MKSRKFTNIRLSGTMNNPQLEKFSSDLKYKLSDLYASLINRFFEILHKNEVEDNNNIYLCNLNIME